MFCSSTTVYAAPVTDIFEKKFPKMAIPEGNPVGSNSCHQCKLYCLLFLLGGGFNF